MAIIADLDSQGRDSISKTELIEIAAHYNHVAMMRGRETTGSGA